MERRIRKSTSFEWIMQCFHLCCAGWMRTYTQFSQKAIDSLSLYSKQLASLNRHSWATLYIVYFTHGCLCLFEWILFCLAIVRSSCLMSFFSFCFKPFYFFLCWLPSGELITHLLSSRLYGDDAGLLMFLRYSRCADARTGRSEEIKFKKKTTKHINP